MKTREGLIAQAKELVKELTLEEKVHLLSGSDDWHMAGVERLGLKPILLSDGPNGVRTLVQEGEYKGEAVPATCFPSLSTVACSFDEALLEEVGSAVAQECLADGVSMLLGPGCNMKRSPLCGRNFEYVSEDPILAGNMTAALVRGVQSKGIYATVKHFACNNQERFRMVSDSVVDERALHEIYFKPYEIAISDGNVANVMCSYNKINGTYVSDSKHILTETLRGELGFDGLVVSDWGAMNDWVGSVEAGMDLAMPGGGLKDRDGILLKAVKRGELSETAVTTAATRVLVNLLQAQQLSKQTFDADVHNALAAKAAAESAVLLENNGILPLNQNKKIAVIGGFAKTPRFQGAGSAQITPIKITSLCDALDARNIPYIYAEGVGAEEVKPDAQKIAQAVACAQNADIAVVMVGLPDGFESESSDREHIGLPESYLALIRELTVAKIPTIAVLVGGSAMSLPFRKNVDALLLVGLTGQNNGEAIADLLCGKVNPSGRLAETYPLEETCQNLSDFGKRDVYYKESIFIGYRYYDKAELEVAYPFGYGLSYTSFAYSDLKLSATELSDQDSLAVTVTITNTGAVSGKEVVQVYVQPPETTLFKAKRELKGFTKVELAPGETKTVTITLQPKHFAYYNIPAHCWHIESGEYGIAICRDSRTPVLEQTVILHGDSSVTVPDYRESAPDYYALSTKKEISTESFAAVYAKLFPEDFQYRPFHLNSTLGDILQIGWISKIYKKVEPKLMQSLMAMGGVEEGDADVDMDGVKAMIDSVLMGLPLRNLVNLSGGALSLKMLQKLVKFFNFTAGKK